MDIKKSNTRFLYMTPAVKFYKDVNQSPRKLPVLSWYLEVLWGFFEITGNGGSSIFLKFKYPEPVGLWFWYFQIPGTDGYPPPNTDHCPSRKYFWLPVLYASSGERSLSECFPIAAATRISDPSFCNSFLTVGRLLFDKKQTTTQEKTEEDFFFCVLKKNSKQFI